MTLTGGLRLARSVEQLGTESAFAVLARARELERQGRSIVHLEIGQPDFPTPIYESAIRWAGAVPVPLTLRDELDFSFSLDELS